MKSKLLEDKSAAIGVFNATFQTLLESERVVLEHRFGLYGKERMLLRHLAELRRVSLPMVYKIEERGLRKLSKLIPNNLWADLLESGHEGLMDLSLKMMKNNFTKDYMIRILRK